jgi:uncharacterized protein YndB with AHSA1/START domain
VFKALTKPKRLAKWFLKDAKINPKEGSSYTFTWQGWFGHTGKVVKVVPDKVLALTWPDESKGRLVSYSCLVHPDEKGEGGQNWIWSTPGSGKGPTGSGSTGPFSPGGLPHESEVCPE